MVKRCAVRRFNELLRPSVSKHRGVTQDQTLEIFTRAILTPFFYPGILST
jgi:hypothetical protein